MNDVERELEHDLALLGTAERERSAHFRVWTTRRPTVVIGRAVTASDEVDEPFCTRSTIAIARRASGGRSVFVGRGTVQYAFALPYSFADELSSIPGAKRFCNRLLIPGVEQAAGLPRGAISEDVSGDLLRDGRKVAGLAMRRRRDAMLLHGTILVSADLALIARVLKHPVCEPAYRRGRSHADFLANLGALDANVLTRVVRALLAAHPSAH